ncbi:MAG: DNA-binding response regulator, partial [Bacteroidetes bacterium]
MPPTPLYRYLAWLTLPFAGLALLLLISAGSRPPEIPAEAVNLALRRTAHLLLEADSDRRSTIPPVQQIDARSYALRLDQGFAYDLLPEILKSSLELQGIESSYDVTVLDCEKGEIRLGYSYRLRGRNDDVACVGREQLRACSQIRLSFPEERPSQVWLPAGLAAGVLLLAMWIIVSPLRKKKEAILPPNDPSPDESEYLSIGKCKLDVTRQILHIGQEQRVLTYREAKLLHYFFSHPNQLLERGRILKAVWEDEGIVVDRSLDVFVSRLRKIVQP